MKRVIVFGSSGALGSVITSNFIDAGWKVKTASRTIGHADICVSDENWASPENLGGTFDAVVWAQGINSSGSVVDVSKSEVDEAFNANVLFIVDTLQRLLSAGALNNPARAVILSSIWQKLSRSDKLAYLVSKSALNGLVPSLAIDLADQGICVNAVLPGVTDSPMTHANLTSDQVARVTSGTPGGRLTALSEVAKVVAFLASNASSGINGQAVVVDRGWSVKREI